MQTWERALELFLANWKEREEVTGILVCGSYITGNPSKRSDIDVHIIINDECDWRERGNQIVNGYLIEYFVNPPKQIRSYFEEDHNDRRPMSMVQFLTGKVLLDKEGAIAQLIEEAKAWKDKRYMELAQPILELKKYSLWDELDNLLDCYEAGRKEFAFVYNNVLWHVYQAYASILNIEEVPCDHVYRYFTDSKYLTKYLKEPFPDTHFAHIYVSAIEAKEQAEKVELVKQLTNYVLDKAGGFSIDGWQLKSNLNNFG